MFAIRAMSLIDGMINTYSFDKAFYEAALTAFSVLKQLGFALRAKHIDCPSRALFIRFGQLI
ncbi:hypothetical protein JF50_19725 [Pseudoalteromonas luteoviolacea]|uniref:Uncharacterized protein n=1 Tax=Pseudoalteromonas luteoviolacea TaxID=43657 RepID=A0A0C1Q6Z7_9GAMM|nr:hypothetical protein JF50_15135 [Pseudoalteromonas luteoviolacea]KID56436.1 hypothetical protein JF50_19725 [Pseudoalteromonas luteoviolacea]